MLTLKSNINVIMTDSLSDSYTINRSLLFAARQKVPCRKHTAPGEGTAFPAG